MNWLMPSVVPVVVDPKAVRLVARSGMSSLNELRRAAAGWRPRDPNKARKLKRLLDPEGTKAKDRAYREKNRERLNERNRQWRARQKLRKMGLA